MGRLAELAALVPAAAAPGGAGEPGAGAFLDCAEAVVPVVQALGVTLMPVQIDMRSNAGRLRERLAEAGPEQVRSVFDFVREEKVRGQHTSDKGCTKDGVPTKKGLDCRLTCELFGCTVPLRSSHAA